LNRENQLLPRIQQNSIVVIGEGSIQQSSADDYVIKWHPETKGRAAKRENAKLYSTRFFFLVFRSRSNSPTSSTAMAVKNLLKRNESQVNKKKKTREKFIFRISPLSFVDVFEPLSFFRRTGNF
jgi:hypothetical protein